MFRTRPVVSGRVFATQVLARNGAQDWLGSQWTSGYLEVAAVSGRLHAATSMPPPREMALPAVGRLTSDDVKFMAGR